MQTTRIPDTWGAQEVRSWLFRTFKDGKSEPVPLFRDIDPAVQIQRIFDDAAAQMQEALKDGTTLALREWRYASHGAAVLEDLCNVAALLRVTAAIPALDRTARNVLKQRRDADGTNVLSILVGTLGGLAPGDDVERALRAIFDDPRCPAPLAGQLFISLCRCRPAHYWQFVPRFRELRNRSSEQFVNVTLAGGFADAVPAQLILDGVKHLTGSDRDDVVWLIENIPDTHVREQLARMRSFPFVPFVPAAASAPSTLPVHDYAAWFREEAAMLATGPTLNEALLRYIPRLGQA